jgi:uncharacterized membrane protein
MGRQRVEAFSDGVFAILITIMVLELKVPHGDRLADLIDLSPLLYTYALSFVFVGIYWNNHHHMMHTVEHTTGGILWANLFLLFWISLFPFGCAWINESQFASLPTAAYSFILFMAAISYWILQSIIIASHGPNSELARAVGSQWKERLSLLFYVVAAFAAFWHPFISQILLVIVAGLWLVPDRRIERVVTRDHRR